MLLQNQVDGIIVGSHDRRIFDQVLTRLPIVAIDQYISDSAPIVSSDNYLGGNLATEHLIKKDCKTIIHMDGPASLKTPIHLSTSVYKDVMEVCGFTPIIYETNQSLNSKVYHELITQIFLENPDIDGIFASDDILATNIYYKALSLIINVPD
ncbi:type 1 periplasmic-binding domain-containing protein [Bacillus bingmayongensis]|uniref:hypothetical protein n=1 Tax=Bacillus bingmayongensis TaxID=1150157 RepID=UPI0021AEE2F7|nr:hypothetical protein [Bacillus bingmayongensis]